jgi:hypothetical protein
MNAKYDERPAQRTWIRMGLLFVAATPFTGGLWALLFPRAFYDDFPLPGRDWVSTLGPFNEHLVRDYGALNLALAVLLVLAAIYFELRLARAALISWLVFATPHFIFHLGQTHHFTAGSNVEQLGGLGLLVLLPLVLLFFAARRKSQPNRKESTP